jgi:hypothetical protein
VIKISATQVRVGKFYSALPLTVWDLITDTDKWPQWGPTVKRVQCPERFIRKGTQGQVLTAFGIWLAFVITEYEHASFWSWNVASVKATGHRLQAANTGGCYLWFEVPIIAAPYSLVCQMALDRIKDQLAKSAKSTA